MDATPRYKAATGTETVIVRIELGERLLGEGQGAGGVTLEARNHRAEQRQLTDDVRGKIGRAECRRRVRQQPFDGSELTHERRGEASDQRQPGPGQDQRARHLLHPGLHQQHIATRENQRHGMPLDQGGGALDIMHQEGIPHRLANQSGLLVPRAGALVERRHLAAQSRRWLSGPAAPPRTGDDSDTSAVHRPAE